MMADRLGKYELLEELGRGGMGVVYRGWDPQLGRSVAIKMIVGVDADPTFLQRFAREAQLIAQLQHPNIVTIHDFAEHDGRPFIVMEYVQGISLDTAIRERRDYALSQKLQIMIEVCRGLESAHAIGIVHRDIKPANIRLTEDGGVKLLDFGIARLAGSTMTRSSEMLGTLAYMSPEAVQGHPVDGRADIFGLGVTLFEWIAWVRPYQGASMGEVVGAILHTPPRRLSEDAPGCPDELARVVDRALEKDPERRFQTVKELRQTLEGCMRGLGADGGAAPMVAAGLSVTADESDTAGSTSASTNVVLEKLEVSAHRGAPSPAEAPGYRGTRGESRTTRTRVRVGSPGARTPSVHCRRSRHREDDARRNLLGDGSSAGAKLRRAWAMLGAARRRRRIRTVSRSPWRAAYESNR